MTLDSWNSGRREITQDPPDTTPGLGLEAAERINKPRAHPLAVEKGGILKGELPQIDPREEFSNLIRSQTQADQQHRYKKLRYVKADKRKLSRHLTSDHLDKVQKIGGARLLRRNGHGAMLELISRPRTRRKTETAPNKCKICTTP